MGREGEYVAKQIGITAIQLRRDNLKAVETFLAGRPMPDFYAKETGWHINWGNGHVTVNTLDGKRKATPGMWIVRSMGHWFVFRDDVFRHRFKRSEVSA